LASRPVYSAIGNHEYYGGGLSRFRDLWDRPGAPSWWSFDVSGVHVVLLDSEAYADPAQLAWLRADLAEAQMRRPRALVALTHHGPWSSGMHGDHPIAIADYAPMLEAARTAVIFSGHDHDFERGRVGQLNYVVSGGGGAELRSPRCDVPGRRPCPPHRASFH